MQEVNKDIENAIKLIKEPYSSHGIYSSYCTSFLFGTENQEGINSIIDYANKDVVTVASSGDQYLGAVYYGANVVDLYDINRLTRYISFLKIAAIKKLSYNEFIDFFLPIGNDGQLKKSFWNLRTLKRLLQLLPNDVGFFWEHIMYEFQKNGYGSFIIPTSYCNKPEMVINGMPFYAQEEEYYKLQDILRKREYPEFKEADILDLGSAFTSKYDIVYLSNIIENLVACEVRSYPFAGYGTEDRVEGEVLELVIPSIHKLVKPNGTVLMSYRPIADANQSTDYLYNCVCFDPYEIPKKHKDNAKDNDYRANTDLVLIYKPTKDRMYM